MKILNWQSLSDTEQKQLLERPSFSQSIDLQERTKAILHLVKEQGDAALFDLTEKFDRVRLSSLRVREEQRLGALDRIPEITREALQLAKDNIERFHRQELPKRFELPTMPGVRCYREPRAIESVGFYIPGGSAPLPSTVLMLGVPSMIAGNPRRVLCTPPQADGSINPVILAAAELCGIDEIYSLGGAQAIAAMAYGTATLKKVDKIFGPGNAWVTEAKLQVASTPGAAAIDMPAGPSEVLVIADSSADPLFLAADLLSQAEHGPDSQVLLVTTSQELAQATLAAIDRLLPRLPRREIAGKALLHSRCFVVDSIKQACQLSDQYAPEHLILHIQEPEVWARQIQHAGSVFLGPYSPESCGDYASGTNHVLPTYGHARSYSGLSVESFMKSISFQHLSQEGLSLLGGAVMHLAQLEGLEAHRLAVDVRLNPKEYLS